MRLAIVHDYLVQGIRGAERVVLEMHRCYPDAPIYTLLFDPQRMGPPWDELDVRPSWLQSLPGALRLYKSLYFLMPLGIEWMRIAECDVVLSSSSAWAKNVRPPRGALHVCYCYTPARFLWHWAREYVRTLRLSAPSRWLVQATLPPLRWWDRRGTGRVHAFIAISKTVQERIRRYYRRESFLVYPPVDTERFTLSAAEPDDYYLVVSALNPYKRVDLAIEACNRLGVRLKIVGDGPEFERLAKMAGPTVEMIGKVPDEELPELYAKCRAFLMPQEEDFGIAAVEAQACGRPVVAYAAGGALETVIDGGTGVLFPEQTAECMAQAIRKLDSIDISPQACRQNADRFNTQRFRAELTGLISELWERWTRGEKRRLA
ncbi:MAG: glycosyltransferase [Armatimonadetes bacterium]|nr:glycosyltransferase [Armatimonadota bacterium]